MVYRPLLSDEIRLLTLKPGEDNPELESDPEVHCTIDYVRLKSQPLRSQSHPHGPYRGSSYIWPEIYSPWSTAALFRGDKHILAQDSTIISEGTLNALEILDSGDNLPWRHEWGDYIALSYVWGSPTPSRLITLNGTSFPVTPNLYEALLHLRRSQRIKQGFKLWIDAICINQADINERSQQVARMRDIYALAWQVVIWLGPEADNSELALNTVHWMARRMRAREPMDGFYHEGRTIDARPLFIKWTTYRSPFKKEVYKALFHLLDRAYWRRMWVLQEVSMAREDAPVICGDRCLSWKDIYDAAIFISNDEGRLGRDIVGIIRPRVLQTWSFEFTRDRVIGERRWASERMWKLLINMMTIQRDQKEHCSMEGPSNALLPFLLGRDADVTEEKDRVYGILGIRSVAAMADIKPDYSQSLSTIYQAFSAELLSRGNLNVLRLVSRPIGWINAEWTVEDVPTTINYRSITPILGPLLSRIKMAGKKVDVSTSCTHRLPSWTICWSCKPAPVAQLQGAYCAGGSTVASSPVIATGNGCLTLKGVIFDTIVSLSSCHSAETDTRYPLNGNQSTMNTYPDLEASKAALWRTITGDTTSGSDSHAPEAYSWLLEPKLWQEGVAGIYSNGFGLHEFMARNKRLILCGYTLEELIFGRSNPYWWQRAGRVYNPTEVQREALSWAMNALAWRRLVDTRNGRIGLAIAAAQTGDKVAIFLGCSMPMLLRECDDGWNLIGECYVHGVMNGELLKSTRRGDAEIGDINLY